MSTVALLGSRPTHFYVPEGSIFTIADEIADLMEAVGYQVDEPERMTCHALYAQKPNGDWAGLESGVVGPRQNLKTSCMIAGAIHDTFVQGLTVNWTAHEFKTSSAAFRDFQGIIESHDWLASEIKTIRTANGNEGFDLVNGAKLNIIARTGKSGRGMAIPRLYLDEGLYLTGKMMGAIIPTLSAMPNAHAVVGSSPGLLESTVLRGMRRRGRGGDDPNLGWIEWSQQQGPCASEDCAHQPGAEGCWLDDLDSVLRVNPAAGRRISIDYIRQERLTLASAPDEYLRERMGVWEDPPNDGANTVYPLDGWTEGLDPRAEMDASASVAWSVDVSWDRRVAHVAACGAFGGRWLVQVVHRCDPSQVAEWLGSRVQMRSSTGVALQSNGAPVSALLLDIIKAVDGQCPVVEMTVSDMAKAYGLTFDAVRDAQVVHVPDPSLDRSVSLGVARSAGDGMVLDRKGSPVDISNLVAATNAYWLAATTDTPGDPGVWFL
jgi:hypothetical protein